MHDTSRLTVNSNLSRRSLLLLRCVLNFATVCHVHLLTPWHRPIKITSSRRSRPLQPRPTSFRPVSYVTTRAQVENGRLLLTFNATRPATASSPARRGMSPPFVLKFFHRLPRRLLTEDAQYNNNNILWDESFSQHVSHGVHRAIAEEYEFADSRIAVR